MWALFSFWKGDVIYGKQIAGVPKNIGRSAAAADHKQGERWNEIIVIQYNIK